MGLMDWMDVAERVVKGVQRVQDQVGPIERLAIQALGSASTINLDDNFLTFLLALAAFDSYTLLGNCNGRLELKISQFQNLLGSNMQNKIQYGLYEISEGRHKGKKILAYRGTEVSGLVTLLQDISLALPSLTYFGQPIKEAIDSAVEITLKHKPDFICGHSLGGLIAECVCSETGIPGASFNAPGQGQKFVAVLKAKNRGAATCQNVKNRGIVAAKIVKIAALSRQKPFKSRLCRGKNGEYRDFV